MNAVVSIPLPRFATDAFLPYTSFVVVLAMLFGAGGTQGWSDAVVQLAALPLLAWALFKLTPSQLGRGGRGAIILLCAILALPVLQLIPLPPSLWSSLPGRREFASAYEAVGMALPWLPISLNPSATQLGLLSLLPATAIFLAILSLEQRQRRILIVLMFIVAFASVVLDLQQTWEGPDSPLRFYTGNTERFRAVGFFANSNHNAAFLYSAVPFIIAWAIGLVRDPGIAAPAVDSAPAIALEQPPRPPGIRLGLCGGGDGRAVVAHKPRSVSHPAGAVIGATGDCGFPGDVVA